MTDMPDQPVQQPRGGAAAAGTTSAPGSAAPGARHRYVPRPAPGYDDVTAADRPPSGPVFGLTVVAALFLMVGGALALFEGLANIIRGTFFAVRPDYAFSMSATGWGILLLIIGGLGIAAGVALFSGAMWARLFGVAIAAFAILANFLFLPYYPVGATVVIAFCALVIWALLSPRNG